MTQLNTPAPGRAPTGGPAGGDLTADAELLGRWAVAADPDALGVIVRRHGGMVLGVCRRVLGHSPDADDAFQATFLVFVRKAGALARPAEVAGWLHGVALRVARKARADRARRREREVGTVALADTPAPEPPEDTSDLRRVLDEELDRLPDKYRLPIVLCELEGRTLDEAARLLGWPKGTVAGRLSRGRDLLRQRLSRRRGLLLPMFLLGGMAPDLRPAAPPDPLVSATVTTATGTGGAATASPPAALAAAVMRQSSRRWVGVFLLVLLFLAALGLGTRTALAGRSAPAGGPPAGAPAPCSSCHSAAS